MKTLSLILNTETAVKSAMQHLVFCILDLLEQDVDTIDVSVSTVGNTIQKMVIQYTYNDTQCILTIPAEYIFFAIEEYMYNERADLSSKAFTKLLDALYSA